MTNQIYTLRTYKGNRIAIKILKELKILGYEVKEGKNRYGESKFFRISTKKSGEEFQKELVYLIPQIFPLNYSFRFGQTPFGYINSFILVGFDIHIKVSHKIKEVKKGTILPKQL